ncbi:hypothetical protein BC351_27345 [Paenibacillus ferrarius]|uniref:Uncharacterized protein n=1 Tax=Paenibacillus ferrarius TaxID=1469647 RepID=A0A1V4HJ82_9BACL|nr:hypothetical protein [Paenibacillus ferrarius]OPH56659.1 hypothetical protein BC351_27345 [Paenibacillus ferrarius]
MFRITRISLILLLFSAILLPAYASASTGSNNSSVNKKTATQTIQQLFSSFTSNKKESKEDLDDFMKKNSKNFDKIKWEDIDCKDSYDIWKKWFCY